MSGDMQLCPGTPSSRACDLLWYYCKGRILIGCSVGYRRVRSLHDLMYGVLSRLLIQALVYLFLGNTLVVELNAQVYNQSGIMSRNY